MAQFGSVLEWGSRGRRFESSHPDHEGTSKLYVFDVFLIFHTLSLQERRSEGIKSAFCGVVLIPSSPVHFPFKRVLPGANFMSSDSAAAKKRISSFSKRTRKALFMSALIEDNAENEGIIPF